MTMATGETKMRTQGNDGSVLRYTDDTSNNIGRRCDVLGLDKPHRSWRITCAVKDITQNGSVTHYEMVNDDGSVVIARTADLTYLY